MKKALFFLLACSLVVSALSFAPFRAAYGAAAAEEETIAGMVTKTDKGIVIEADDGDYLVKGKDLSKMVNKLVEATGVITESSKGDVIDVKSFEEIQE